MTIIFLYSKSFQRCFENCANVWVQIFQVFFLLEIEEKLLKSKNEEFPFVVNGIKWSSKKNIHHFRHLFTKKWKVKFGFLFFLVNESISDFDFFCLFEQDWLFKKKRRNAKLDFSSSKVFHECRKEENRLKIYCSKKVFDCNKTYFIRRRRIFGSFGLMKQFDLWIRKDFL